MSILIYSLCNIFIFGSFGPPYTQLSLNVTLIKCNNTRLPFASADARGRPVPAPPPAGAEVEAEGLRGI